jgi:hypothetical protein
MKANYNSKLHLIIGIVPSLLCASLLAPKAKAQTWDLASDWSTTTNPNGVWTYREGSKILTAESWYDSLPSAVPSWEDYYSPTSPETIPAWFLSTSNPLPGLDWTAGDVVVHTQDNTNGAGNGQADVLWTSPINGFIDLAGGVWMGRDIGRAAIWNIYVNDSLVSSGSIYSGDPYSSSDPFEFNTGSGGANVMQNVPVTVGETVELEVANNSTYGDYVGVQFSISSVPEPTTSVSWILGAGLLLSRRRRRYAGHPAVL